jgi:RNA-binding protein 23/39
LFYVRPDTKISTGNGLEKSKTVGNNRTGRRTSIFHTATSFSETPRHRSNCGIIHGFYCSILMASTTLNSAPHKSEEDRLRDRLKRRQETRRNPVIEPRRDDRRYYGPPPRTRGPIDHGRERPHPPLQRLERSRPPPPHYSRGPPPNRSSFHVGSQSRRHRSPSSSTSRRSYSRSRSRSPRRYGRRSRSYSSDSYSSSQSDGTSYSSTSSSRSSRTESDIEDLSSKGKEESGGSNQNNAATKDQRTVFVSQLVMRADERDLKHYFQKVLMCPVKEVIILRDKRNHRHKGCAYVELKRFEDISKALEASQKPPDFQRFPILIKASEAEKNHVHPSQLTLTAQQMGASVPKAPILRDGKLIEAQKVYIGNLDPSVSQELLYSIFSKFGFLDKVAIQLDPITGTSRGFAFLSFRDPKDANLAIHTMNSQVLAGRPL